MNLISNVSVGTPTVEGRWSIFPLYLSGTRAIRNEVRGWGVSIYEQNAANVPTLMLENDSSTWVLVPSGAIVGGGLQNRVINTSALLSPHYGTDVPVSCIEQGRWSGNRNFDHGTTFAPRRVRRVLRTSSSRDSDGRSRADQHAVWQTVHEALVSRGADNATHDLRGIRAASRAPERDRLIDELVRSGPRPGQIGIAVCRGSRVVSAELFGSEQLLQDFWEELIRAAFDENEPSGRGTGTSDAVLRFLARANNSDVMPEASIGHGRTVALRSDRIAGQVLEHEGALVHASMFALA